MSEPNASPDPKRENDAATATSDVIARPVNPRKQFDRIPKNFGRYRIEETLGKGGMGAVFRAYDTQLDRQVALKVPFLGDDEAETRQRFFREARAAATLQHAYICPVFDVGEYEGVPYLTMAFIEGRSLNQALTAGQSFTFPQIALLIRKIALGMQEAHSRGVVHRDLKPANILLRPNGEPVIMDFGLARRADDKRSHGLTQEGDILGTLDYMSPEQAEGAAANVGPPADIYALGAILYELLCGKRPFSGNTASMLVQILTKEPPAPSELRAGVPEKLEAICHRSMAKKADDRFPSMTAFAAALAEFLRGLQQQGGGVATMVSKSGPVPVVPAPPAAETPRPANTAVAPKEPKEKDPERSSAPKSGPRSGRKGPRSGKRPKAKKQSNLPIILGGAVAVMAVAIVAIVVAVAMTSKKKDPNADVADAAKSNQGGPPPGFTMPGGNRPVPNIPGRQPGDQRPNPPTNAGGGPGPTPPNNPPQRGPGNSAPGFAVLPMPDNLTLGVGDSQKVTIKVARKDYQGPITVSWTGPSELQVTPPSPIRLRSDQGEAVLTVRVVAPPTTDQLRLEVSASYDTEPQRGAVKTALAVKASANSACLRVIAPQLKGGFHVDTVVFPPDMAIALIGGGTGKVDRGNPGPGPGPGPAGGGVPGSGPPQGEPGDNNAINLLSLQTGQIIGKLAGHQDRVSSISIAGDGKTAISCGADENVCFWDVAQGKLKNQSGKQTAHVLNLALAPDGKRGLLLTTSALLKFNPETFRPIAPHTYFLSKLTGNKEPDALRCCALTTDGKALVGGLDGKLLFLDIPDKGKVATPKPMTGHDEAVLCATFDSSGRFAATGGGGTLKAGAIQSGRDNAVRLWDMSTQALSWKGDGHTDSVLCVAFSPESDLVASGSADGSVRIWRVADGASVATFTGHTGRVLGVAFAPDGKTVWSGSADKTLRQWRLP